MHLLQTKPNSMANSLISLDDEGFVWDSDGLDFISSLSSSSSLIESSLSLIGILSSAEDFFLLTISSSSSVFVVVVGFKRLGGGGFEFATIGADRFFYWNQTEQCEWSKEEEKLTVNGCGELDVVCKSDFESDDEDSGEFYKEKQRKSSNYSKDQWITFGEDLLICLFSLINSSINNSNCSDISDEFDRNIESVRCK